jgi:archaellum component FlaF (FlaF/FlaG flagellin family)
MKIKILEIEEGDSGKVSLTNGGSLELKVSKRSVLFKGIKIQKGDIFEITLKAVKISKTKK